MSDDLKNSLKQLESYVKEESKLKQKAQVKLERDLQKAAYRQRSFPVNKIIFFSTVFSISSIMFGQKLLPLVNRYAPKQVADQYAQVLKQTDELLGKVDDLKKIPSGTKSTQDALDAARFETPQDGAEGHREVAAQPAKATGPEWVQIDRKWYKKTADNIYFVNGKKMLFIENRQREAPKSADEAANAAAPTQNR